MVDLNIDVGEFFKNLFSKKKESKEGVSTATSEKIQSKTALLIGGAVGILLIVCFIYFFIFRPQLNEQRKMMEKKNNYEKELVQLQSQLKKREQYFEEIKEKSSGKMKLSLKSMILMLACAFPDRAKKYIVELYEKHGCHFCW